jgi:hypothetical protein
MNLRFIVSQVNNSRKLLKIKFFIILYDAFLSHQEDSSTISDGSQTTI